jgi:hypothetical protein
MNSNKLDVQPSVENKGLILRAKATKAFTERDQQQQLVENERVTKMHLTTMAEYERRDIHAASPNVGLVLIGPSSGDNAFPFAKAYNASMAVLDAKLAELDAKLAAVAAALAILEGAKK